MEDGTASKPLQRWASLGHPNSLRLETRQRRSSLLVEAQNKSPLLPDENRSVIKIVPHSCDRTTCPQCRVRIGTDIKYALEERLRELQAKYGKNGAVRMWTLTLDQKKYTDPETAHRKVQDTEKIRRMAAKAGWKYWVAVTEWHQSGWPHYHVLVWTPHLRKDKKTNTWRYPHEDHATYQKLWGLGWANFSDRPDKKPAAAIRYLTAYISKTEKAPIPDWLLDSKNVRLISASTGPDGWGKTRSRKSHRRSLYTRDAVAAREPNRTNREAQATCGDSCNLLECLLDTVTGEIKNQWVTKVPISWRTVKRLITRTDPEDHARTTQFSVQLYDDNSTTKRLIRLINRVKFAQ